MVLQKVLFLTKVISTADSLIEGESAVYFQMAQNEIQ